MATEPPTLRVGMDPRAVPWVFVPGAEHMPEHVGSPPRLSESQLKRLVGFEIDLLNALCRRLGVRPQIVQISWRDLEEGLITGRYDVILAEWTPNSQTSPEILASTPYCEWSLLVVARADNDRIQSIADLGGKTVGYYPDPSVEAGLTAMLRSLGAEYEAASTKVLFRELRAGHFDAVIYDSLYVHWLVAQDPGLRIVGGPLNRLGYHVGVRRQNSGLLDHINVVIKEMIAAGEVEVIRQRWEGNHR